MLIIFLSLASLISGGLFIYYLKEVTKVKFAPSLRGLFRYYVSNTLSSKNKSAILIWFMSSILLFLCICSWIMYMTWQTDYNFITVTFALFAGIWLIRFFLWEKSDLMQFAGKKRKED